MAGRQLINTGTIPGDHTGDVAPLPFTKLNAMTAELYPWAQRNAPSGIAPSGFFAANGVFVIGQAPTGAATVSFSATSGSVTMTFSAATLLGTAADVGRILTILDSGVYKTATITTQNSTTVATAALSATLSGTGPFANNIIWLTGSPNTDTSGFGVPFLNVWPGIYLQFPANAIGAGVAAGSYFCVMQSLTQGQAYNNPLPLLSVPGVSEPGTPATLTAFAIAGGGAYSNPTTTYFTLASYVLPGGTLGRYGRIVVRGMNMQPSDATSKAYQVLFGGTSILNGVPSTNNIHPILATLANLGVTNYQMKDNILGTDGTTVAVGPSIPMVTTVDTSVDQQIVLQQQLANAKDWAMFCFHTIEIYPAS